MNAEVVGMPRKSQVLSRGAERLLVAPLQLFAHPIDPALFDQKRQAGAIASFPGTMIPKDQCDIAADRSRFSRQGEHIERRCQPHSARTLLAANMDVESRCWPTFDIGD